MAMDVDQPSNIALYEEQLDNVNNFKSLGAMLTEKELARKRFN